MLTLLYPSHLCILWPGSCQFDEKSINQKPVNISSQNMLCRGNQWTCYYMIGTSVMKELIVTSLSLNITCIYHRNTITHIIFYFMLYYILYFILYYILYYISMHILNVKWSLTRHYWIQGFMNVTVWKVCVFGVFLVRIFPHSDWMRRDSEYPYSVQIRENKDQKNSEYGHFSRSVCHRSHGNLVLVSLVSVAVMRYSKNCVLITLIISC